MFLKKIAHPLFFCVFAALSTCAFSQVEYGTNSDRGKIVVHSSGNIDSLERHDRGRRELEGYRIQIFLGDFANAKTTRTKFLSSGIPLSAYPVQLPPQYAVRVGDFLTLMDAHKYLVEVKRTYPEAFVVEDKIEGPRLEKK